MKNIIIKCRILSCRYAGMTRMGNPYFNVAFLNGNNNVIKARTKYNGLPSYKIENFVHKECLINFHYTDKGNCIIDDVTKYIKSMKIYTEQSLRYFDFWCEAAENAATITDRQLNELESILEEEYPDGISETVLNDIMRFDFDTVKEWLGIED